MSVTVSSSSLVLSRTSRGSATAGVATPGSVRTRLLSAARVTRAAPEAVPFFPFVANPALTARSLLFPFPDSSSKPPPRRASEPSSEASSASVSPPAAELGGDARPDPSDPSSDAFEDIPPRASVPGSNDPLGVVGGVYERSERAPPPGERARGSEPVSSSVPRTRSHAAASAALASVPGARRSPSSANPMSSRSSPSRPIIIPAFAALTAASASATEAPEEYPKISYACAALAGVSPECQLASSNESKSRSS